MASEPISYLRSLPAIRERCSRVFSLAERDELEYWSLDLTRESEIVDFVCDLIARDYGTNYDSIPPHGRWRHFVGDRVDPLLDSWQKANVGVLEIARRLVDLMVVSVLMDAGAGNKWSFKPKDGGEPITRSEGLAVGSLEMFESGMFSSDASQPHQVNAEGLSKISPEGIAKAMQVTDDNPMDGIEGRAGLLVRLGSVLTDKSKYFSQGRSFRPGHLIDYLLSHPKSQQTPSPNMVKLAVPIEVLWEIIIQGLNGVWPAARTKIDGVSLGDVWKCEAIKSNDEHESLVPFHKLSQWLTYSLIEVMEKILGWQFLGKESMTGLPEYRNGGLLIDFNLLQPKIPALLKSFGQSSSGDKEPELLDLPPLPASHSAIVEFRAVTVIMLDRLAEGIRRKTGVPSLSLPQVLEAGTWKAGREIAKKKRPATGGPPLNVVLDGTVF